MLMNNYVDSCYALYQCSCSRDFMLQAWWMAKHVDKKGYGRLLCNIPSCSGLLVSFAWFDVMWPTMSAKCSLLSPCIKVSLMFGIVDYSQNWAAPRCEWSDCRTCQVNISARVRMLNIACRHVGSSCVRDQAFLCWTAGGQHGMRPLLPIHGWTICSEALVSLPWF